MLRISKEVPVSPTNGSDGNGDSNVTIGTMCFGYALRVFEGVASVEGGRMKGASVGDVSGAPAPAPSPGHGPPRPPRPPFDERWEGCRLGIAGPCTVRC